MSEERIYVVDRIEGSSIVLVSDDEREIVLRPRDLPVRVSEGTVLRVRMEGDAPEWSSALIDAEERERREEWARRQMEQLRKRDPGGDLEL